MSMRRLPLSLLLCLLPLTGCPSGADDDDAVGDDDDADDDDDAADDDDASSCAAPEAPGAVTADGPTFPTEPPPLTWTAAAAECEVASYEVAVGSTAGADNIVGWTDVGDVLEWSSDDVRLDPYGDNVLSVRAVDVDGNAGASGSVQLDLWEPTDLSGLRLWLDFRDPGAVFTDEACTTEAGLGDPVRCVDDKSGAGPGVTYTEGQMGNYEPPVLANTSFGGRVYAEFDTNKVLTSGADVSSYDIQSNELTAAFVTAPQFVDANIGGAHNMILCMERAYEFAFFDQHLMAAIDTEHLANWQWGGVSSQVQPAGEQLNTFLYDGSSWIFRYDGAETGAIPATNNQRGVISAGSYEVRPPGAPPIIIDPPLVVGARLHGLTDDDPENDPGSWGDFGDLILYERMLPEAELADLEKYLTQKWGL